MELKLDFKIVAKDGLPKKSGNYFVVQKYDDGTAKVTDVEYSAWHKAFNSSDLIEYLPDLVFTDVIAYCEVPQEWFDNLVKEVYQK